MRNLISIAISLLLASPAAFCAGPVIKFLDTTHDFGNIKEASGAVSHDFRFTNTGDAPLVILSVTTSCGCTKPTFPKQPVEPGDTAVVTITYNPVGRPGEFDKNISVKSNSPKAPKSRLKISGVVLPK